MSIDEEEAGEMERESETEIGWFVIVIGISRGLGNDGVFIIFQFLILIIL